MNKIKILEDCLEEVIIDLTYYRDKNGYQSYIKELEKIITTLKEGVTTDWEELKKVSGLIRKSEIYLDKAKQLQKEYEEEQIKDADNEFEVSKNTRAIMQKAKKSIASANESGDFGLES